jgi:4-oxalomesaconate hydratase
MVGRWCFLELLTKDLIMPSPLKLLAIVCHPADAIDGAGGTLCLHAERGDEVTVVVVTHGVDTHDLERNDALRFGGDRTMGALLDHSQAIGRKEKEVIEGLALLGVHDVRFLRFPDELLTVSTELIKTIAAVMADVGHADSAIAALKARYLANTPRFLKQSTGRTFPAQVFFMTMNGKTNQLTAEGYRHGNVLIDITPVVERKVQAMDCLRSQFYPGHLARKVVEIVNGRMGLHWRMSYAEEFQTLYPHGYSHLPANEHLMMLANTPAADKVGDMRIRVTDVSFHPNPES